MTASQNQESLTLVGQRYAVLSRLREEPWGEVWLAQDRFLNQEVGLKFLPRETEHFEVGQEILKQEARQGLELRHPFILGVLHCGLTEEGAYLLEEPFSGESMMEQLARQRRYTLSQALDLVEKAAEALAAAHDQNIVHYSFNPVNILLKDDDLRVANFAFPPLDDDQVLHLELKAYHAPEVIQGERLTPAGNVFSLGVLGFRLMAGSLPYPLTFDEAFPYRLESAPVDLEEIPIPLQNLLLQCLAPDPEERFPDAGAFLLQLEQARELWRSGAREKWRGYWAERGAAGAEKARNAAAALLGKLRGQGQAWGQQLQGKFPALGERLKVAPARVWWGLGLAALTAAVVWGGVKIMGLGPSSPLQQAAPVEALKIPTAGGPPLTQGEEAALPPPVAAPPTTRVPGPVLATPPPAAVKPAREERFVVVAASFSKEEQAKALQKRLKSRNITAGVAKVGKGYQVRLGPVTGNKKAEDLAKRLQAEGLSPRITKVAAAPATPKTSKKTKL